MNFFKYVNCICPRGLRPRRQKSCGVWYPAEQNPAWSDTPQTKIPRGLIPRRTTFEFEYLREFETEFENILGYESGAKVGVINEKISG